MRAFAQERGRVQRVPAYSGLALSNAATQGPRRDAGLILRLQRTAGNRAVGRMLQTKLKVSKPGDEYEREADRVADQVMRMPDGASRKDVSVSPKARGPEARRKCDECEEEEGKGLLQKSAASDSRTDADGSSEIPPVVGEVLNSPGEPLDAATRAFMEPRLGADFGNVRVHSDSAAAESARALNAHAYTVGEQIVFDRGRYAPGTDEGKRLLAHELTHVVQQGGPAPSRAANTVQREEQKEQKVATGATDPEKMKERCGDPCAKFPWFEVAPGRFLSLCDDSVKLGYPIIEPEGCDPNGSGNVIFHAGNLAASKPAWDLRSDYSYCPDVPKGQKVTPKIELGYIQTVEKALFGGVYYKKNAANKWEWSGNEWLCVANARDGHKTSREPWYGPDPSGHLGPEPYPGNPMLADDPHVKLPSHKDGGTLRRMRMDGVFHIWLIAKRADGTIVYIHNWTIELLAVTELDDGGHPCLKSAWSWKWGGPTVASSGPGPGSATAVLTGKTANELRKPC